MTTTKRIGILTGGGDVPGLNAVIKSVVYRATEARLRRPRDPARLGGPDPRPARASASTPSTCGRSTGRTRGRSTGPAARSCTPRGRTRGRCARRGCPPGSTDAERARFATGDGIYDLTPLVLDHLGQLGHRRRWSRSAATTRCPTRRSSSTRACRSMAIPKTMDNDVQGTEYCIGFSTAITRAKEPINRQRTTLGSHERIGVFRIFGRDAGFSALYTAYVTSARCVIPEAPYDLDAARRAPRRGPCGQPEPLRVRHHRRGRDLAGRPDGRGRARPTRSATATRRTSARRSRASSRARTGIETARVRADLRPALGRAGLARLDGRDHLRQRRDGPRRRRGRRAGWSPSRTASTRTRRSPIRRSGRARSTSR